MTSFGSILSLRDHCRSVTRKSVSAPQLDHHMVVDALMTELRYHIRLAGRREAEQQQEESRMRKDVVDYSWLSIDGQKSRGCDVGLKSNFLELEELCSELTPSECGQVLKSFRQAAVQEEEEGRTVYGSKELPHLLRAVVRKTLAERPPPKPKTTERIVRSLTGLKLIRPSVRTSVRPMTFCEGELEKRRRSEAAETGSNKSSMSTEMSFVVVPRAGGSDVTAGCGHANRNLAYATPLFQRNIFQTSCGVDADDEADTSNDDPCIFFSRSPSPAHHKISNTAL